MRKRQKQSERLEIMKDSIRKLEKVEEKIEKNTEPESKARYGKKQQQNYQLNGMKQRIV